MVSKIEKFKTTTWGQVGKHTDAHGQRVFLAGLLGIGLIAWALLRFTVTVLDVVFGVERENASSPLYLQENEELDILGRNPGDSFYGRSLSNADLLEEIEEYEKKHNW